MKPLAFLALAAATTLASGRALADDAGADAAPATDAGAPAKTIVSLTFDDTLGDQYDQVRTLLSTHHAHATFYVNSGRIDQPGYMTLDQVKMLEEDGNEIGGHTVHHVQLTPLPLDERRRQICDDRVWLLGFGFRVTDFAYPLADQDSDTQQIAADCGYASARGVGDLSCPSCSSAETVPPAQSMLIRTPSSIIPSTTIGDLENYVMAAEPDGGWVPLVFHHACDGCNPLSISPQTLASFLDWLEAREPRGTVIRTVNEVLGGDPLPPVTIPDPAPPAIGAEGAPNGSFEIDNDTYGDGVPDCWQTGGAAKTPGAVQRVGDAHDGQFALTIAGNGDTARLVARQDMGACSAEAVPGHQYVVSAWTKGGSARLIAYTRGSHGQWTFWQASPPIPTSQDYARAAWTTDALPEGITAISVGIEIDKGSTSTIDSISLVDTGAAGSPEQKAAMGSKGCDASGNGKRTGGQGAAWVAIGAAVLASSRVRRRRHGRKAP